MVRPSRVINFLLLILLLAGTSACGAQRSASSETGAASEAYAPRLNNAAAPAVGDSAPMPAAQAAPAGTSTGAAYPTSAPAVGDSAPVPALPAAQADPGRPAQPPVYGSDLTAGQIDDNARFGEYLNYLHDYQGQTVHPIPVERRLFVRVLDNDQHPVAGSHVTLFDGDRQVFEGQTVSDGRVLFFPDAAGAAQVAHFRAAVERGGQRVEATIKAGEPEQTIIMPALQDNTGPVGLDIVFLVDSTGSMGDEIAKIKATVDSVAKRIEQLPGSSAPRLGLVVYRDLGDDYVVRSWDFGSVEQFTANLAGVQAAGGGDEPESVNAALHEAIHLPGWAANNTGRHLRLIVQVADAPPHLDYPNDYEYTNLLQEAVGAGIKIFPIGASGLNDQGEYIYRQFAQVTQGRFVFLTYADGVSGDPGPYTDHHVSNYSVQNLDSLVVGLVAGEVANQTGQAIEATGPATVAPESATIAPPTGGPAAWLDDLKKLFTDPARGWTAALWLIGLVLIAAWARRDAQVEKMRSAAGEDLPDPGAEDLAGAEAGAQENAYTLAMASLSAPAPDLAPYYYDLPAGQPTMPLTGRRG